MLEPAKLSSLMEICRRERRVFKCRALLEGCLDASSRSGVRLSCLGLRNGPQVQLLLGQGCNLPPLESSRTPWIRVLVMQSPHKIVFDSEMLGYDNDI